MPPESCQQTDGKRQKAARKRWKAAGKRWKYIEEKVYKEDAQKDLFDTENNHIQLLQRINQFFQSISFFSGDQKSDNSRLLSGTL